MTNQNAMPVATKIVSMRTSAVPAAAAGRGVTSWRSRGGGSGKAAGGSRAGAAARQTNANEKSSVAGAEPATLALKRGNGGSKPIPNVRICTLAEVQPTDILWTTMFTVHFTVVENAEVIFGSRTCLKGPLVRGL
jgi:hypothetical protein